MAQPSSRQELIEQAYREVTADGLPQGGDVEAMKLAEAIVDDLKEGDYVSLMSSTFVATPLGNLPKQENFKIAIAGCLFGIISYGFLVGSILSVVALALLLIDYQKFNNQ